jgi:hypothetical protein
MSSDKRKEDQAGRKDKEKYDRAEVEALLQKVAEDARREQGTEMPTSRRRDKKLVRWNSESSNLLVSSFVQDISGFIRSGTIRPTDSGAHSPVYTW